MTENPLDPEELRLSMHPYLGQHILYGLTSVVLNHLSQNSISHNLLAK